MLSRITNFQSPPLKAKCCRLLTTIKKAYIYIYMNDFFIFLYLFSYTFFDVYQSQCIDITFKIIMLPHKIYIIYYIMDLWMCCNVDIAVRRGIAL